MDSDPLRYGANYDDDMQDMEDVTAQLESALHVDYSRDSHDGGLGFGDAEDMMGLNRYHRVSDNATTSGRNDTFPADNGVLPSAYHTFGPLGEPPSYEDSVIPSSSALPRPSSSTQHSVPRASPRTDYSSAASGSTAGTGAGSSSSGPPLLPGCSGASGSGSQAEAPPSAIGLTNGLRRSPARPSQKELPLLEISISDPIRREQTGMFGMKGHYISYLVRTSTQLPGFTLNGDSGVRRRFRDFVGLADVLKVRYRGYFLPPRPDKNAMEGQRQNDTFLEERRSELEQYVNNLARHPAIVRSEELHVFLTAVGELSENPTWSAMLPLAGGSGLVDSTTRFSKQLLGLERSVVDPVQAVQATNKTGDLMRTVKETVQSLTVTAHDDGELSLRRTREQLEEMREALAVASRAAEKLVGRMDRRAVVQSDLSTSLNKVSREEENRGAPLASHTGTVRQHHAIVQGSLVAAEALVRVSRSSRKATGMAAGELGVLHDYLGLTPCAIKALLAREQQLLTHDTLQADIEAKRKSIADLEVSGAKVFGGDASKARRIAELKADVSKLELSLGAAKVEYDKIKAINLQELDTFHRSYRQDLLHMVRTTGNVLAAEAEQELKFWMRLAGELGVPPDEVTAAGRVSSAALAAAKERKGS